jgi:CubicO group peptidase (beta-lactamase class C family)
MSKEQLADILARLEHFEDIEGIKQLKYRYCAYCDNGYDAEAIGALFTEDGVWEASEPYGAIVGREAIVEFFRSMPEVVSFPVHTVAKLADAKGGLYLRPRDMARIMQLWLNEGRWDDQQIVPADWVRDSVSPATPHTYPESSTWAIWVMDTSGGISLHLWASRCKLLAGWVLAVNGRSRYRIWI